VPRSPTATAASAAGRVIAMSAGDMRIYLGQLMAERLEATGAGLGENVFYMSHLAAARNAYVGLAVTEIETLRGRLSGRQVG
jgi:hypothetical protein